MKSQIKQLLGLGMILLGLLVLFAVMGGRYSGGRPIIPALVPVFGLEFGIVFAVFQIGFCLFFNAKKGLIWMAAIWLIAAPLIHITAFARYSPEAVSGIPRIVTGSACASAIALGISVVRGKL